jgi:hypothetical protein
MARAKPYEPKGRMADLVSALEAEPGRTFTSQEAAQIMGCELVAVSSAVFYAVRAGRIFKKAQSRRLLLLRATPFPGESSQANRPINVRKEADGWATDPDDPRIGKVVLGWKPPQMVCVRLAANDSRRKAA